MRVAAGEGCCVCVMECMNMLEGRMPTVLAMDSLKAVWARWLDLKSEKFSPVIVCEELMVIMVLFICVG